MNVVDSSAWLEYFAAGRNASYFSEAIESTRELLVPSICLYEVFKRVVQQRSESDALQAVAVMEQGRVIDMDAPTALSAARISVDLKLSMADSVILAISRHYKAVLWTQDGHFEGLEYVRFKRATGK